MTSGVALGGEIVATATGGAGRTELLKAVGLFGASNLGDGLTLKLGIMVDQDGPTAAADSLSVNGARLAAAQIKAAGGPDIRLIVETTKSGDDSAVGRALDELAVAGSPVVLTGSVGETPQMLDGLEMHKILGLDSEGWVTDVSQGKDLLVPRQHLWRRFEVVI